MTHLNIQKYENGENNTGKLEKRLAACLKGKKVKDHTREEIIPILSRLIVQSYYIVGYQNYNDKDVSMFSVMLLKELNERYFFLTIQEVAFCMEQGAKGDYGDFTGVNLRTVLRWLKIYRQSEVRAKARYLLARPALPTVTPEYNEMCAKRHMRSVYERFKKGYPVEQMIPWYAYQTMQRLGWIVDSLEVKLRTMHEAEKKCRLNARFQRESPEEKKEAIKTEAMTILLKIHLKRWKDMEDDGFDLEAVFI